MNKFGGFLVEFSWTWVCNEAVAIDAYVNRIKAVISQLMRWNGIYTSCLQHLYIYIPSNTWLYVSIFQLGMRSFPLLLSTSSEILEWNGIIWLAHLPFL